MDHQAYSNALFYIASLDKRYKVNRNVGWVYAAHNPNLGASILKIGMSSRPPPQRAQELARSTGYEGPFRLAYFVHVSDRYEAERWVHRSLDRHRVRSWEEFFELPLNTACDTLDQAAQHFPLLEGLPNRYFPEGSLAPMPQVFRRLRLPCPKCGQVNEVRELAVRVRVRCSRCGQQLGLHGGTDGQVL